MFEIFFIETSEIGRVEGKVFPVLVNVTVTLKVPATAVASMFKGQVFVPHMPTVSQVGAPAKVAVKV
jgi:hypothetical protein